MNITTGKALKYAALPGFIPRIFALATSGFSTLAYYMATVYNIVKLLPDDHPYLIHKNIGKFGLRNVIVAAANNLVFKWKNIDQIIIYFTILGAMILIGMQIVLLIMALLASQTAFATTLGTPSSYALGAGFGITELFKNPSAIGAVGPEQDIAFIILDRVFGLAPSATGGDALFNSCIAQGTGCENNAGNAIVESKIAYPYPFHRALHYMLQYYSLGIIVISTIIFTYLTITVIGETAATGTPFGQRFNRAWAPVRFVLFFGMVVPLNIGGTNEGINGAQWVTFMTAKFGSNFATNAWAHFDTTLGASTANSINATPAGAKKLIATPNTPEVGSLLRFVMVAKTCAFAEGFAMDNEVIPYIVRAATPAYLTSSGSVPTATQDSIQFLATNYAAARAFSHKSDIKIRFGVKGTGATGSGVIENFSEFAGNVKPYCGDMIIRTTSAGDNPEPGTTHIETEYYKLLQDLWEDPFINNAAQCEARNNLGGHHRTAFCDSFNFKNIAFIKSKITTLKTDVEKIITDGIAIQLNQPNNTLIKKGWAGAAIWYNRIAEMNGGIITAANNLPQYSKYPWAMELTREERKRADANVSARNQFSTFINNEQQIELPLRREVITHPAMYAMYDFFEEYGTGENPNKDESNAFIGTVNFLFGTEGLFEMRRTDNQDTHPLAQLTAVGKGMMDAVVRNAAIAIGGSLAGGLAGLIDDFPAQLSKAASSFSWVVIANTIGIAVILYYVLPFLPFIYFMFAVSGWVKSIFEAIVAMPLWALAHIRIDGEGIPGQDASNGYFLLLEIFLRPILILIGLIASVSIFAALVSTLNVIFDLIVPNVTGSSASQAASKSPLIPTSINQYRQPIDEFFFTAMYAIICYLMGISCFKLIDLVPNNIMRWMGTTVATFQENAGDPAGTLTNQVYRGSVLVSNQVQGATQGNLQAILG